MKAKKVEGMDWLFDSKFYGASSSNPIHSIEVGETIEIETEDDAEKVRIQKNLSCTAARCGKKFKSRSIDGKLYVRRLA